MADKYNIPSRDFPFNCIKEAQVLSIELTGNWPAKTEHVRKKKKPANVSNNRV